MAARLFRRYEMFEEKEVGKVVERGRRRAFAKFVGVGVVLALILLLTSVTSLPTGYAGAFPGANGKIAFGAYRDGNGEIYVMNPDGTNQTRLTTDSAADGRPSWSADGTKIAFESNRDGNFEIFVMNADGSSQTQLTFTSPPVSNYQPSWSPDGTKIVFTSDRPSGTNGEIYVMNADGTNQTQLTYNPTSDGDPTWSPDGTKIVFGSDRDGNPEIYVMNADGTNQIRLTTNPASDSSQSWSPDGTKIVFESNRDGNPEIYAMNADGTSQTRLTTNPANDNLPSWSPDGAKIAFQSDRDGNGEIYVMNADGTGQTNLSNNSAGDGGPDWQPLPAELIATFDNPEVYPGDTVEVALDILGANDLYAAQATCSVAPTILEPQSGTFGDFFDPVNRIVAANEVSPTLGTWFGAISQQNPAGPLSGNGLFATVTYQALSPGATAITCDPLLSDRDGFTQTVSFTATSDITVLPFGTISGTATYQGRLTHAGIVVTATGIVTSTDTTDSDGSFTLGQLRAYTYTVEADVASYLPSCAANVVVASGETVTLTATTLLGGDLNDDDTINIGDATLLTANFGLPVPPADARADINADLVVNVQDLAILAGNYEVSGCQAW